MPNEMSRNDPIALWQEQEPDELVIPVDEIRLKAAELENSIRSKQRRDITVGLLAVIVFVLAILQGLAQGIAVWRLAPMAFLILGTLFVMSQIQRRIQFPSLPAEASAETYVGFHRQQLQRQRDYLQSMWRWYVLLFLPGFVSAAIVAAIGRGVDTKLVGSVLLLVLVVKSGWARNKQSIQKVDRRLQELTGLETLNE